MALCSQVLYGPPIHLHTASSPNQTAPCAGRAKTDFVCSSEGIKHAFAFKNAVAQRLQSGSLLFLSSFFFFSPLQAWIACYKSGIFFVFCCLFFFHTKPLFCSIRSHPRFAPESQQDLPSGYPSPPPTSHRHSHLGVWHWHGITARLTLRLTWYWHKDEKKKKKKEEEDGTRLALLVLAIAWHFDLSALTAGSEHQTDIAAQEDVMLNFPTLEPPHTSNWN